MTSTRAELPDGVQLNEDGLIDAVRQGAVALNPSAVALLRAALDDDGAATIARLSDESDVAASRINADLETLVAGLNRLGFINCTGGATPARLAAWLRTSTGLLRAGIPPAHGPMCNRRTGTSGGPRGAAPGLAAMCGVMLRVALLMLAGAAIVAITTGGDVIVAAMFILATPVGIAMHELAHLVALGSGPAAVLTSTFGVRILHPPLPGPRRRIEVAAGPLFPTVTGLALLVIFGDGQGEIVVAAAIPLVAHALNLLALAGDGGALVAGLRYRLAVAFAVGVGVGAVLAIAAAQAVTLPAQIHWLVASALTVGLLNALLARIAGGGARDSGAVSAGRR